MFLICHYTMIRVGYRRMGSSGRHHIPMDITKVGGEHGINMLYSFKNNCFNKTCSNKSYKMARD